MYVLPFQVLCFFSSNLLTSILCNTHYKFLLDLTWSDIFCEQRRFHNQGNNNQKSQHRSKHGSVDWIEPQKSEQYILKFLQEAKLLKNRAINRTSENKSHFQLMFSLEYNKVWIWVPTTCPGEQRLAAVLLRMAPYDAATEQTANIHQWKSVIIA